MKKGRRDPRERFSFHLTSLFKIPKFYSGRPELIRQSTYVCEMNTYTLLWPLVFVSLAALCCQSKPFVKSTPKELIYWHLDPQTPTLNRPFTLYFTLSPSFLPSLTESKWDRTTIVRHLSFSIDHVVSWAVDEHLLRPAYEHDPSPTAAESYAQDIATPPLTKLDLSQQLGMAVNDQDVRFYRHILEKERQQNQVDVRLPGQHEPLQMLAAGQFRVRPISVQTLKNQRANPVAQDLLSWLDRVNSYSPQAEDIQAEEQTVFALQVRLEPSMIHWLSTTFSLVVRRKSDGELVGRSPSLKASWPRLASKAMFDYVTDSVSNTASSWHQVSQAAQQHYQKLNKMLSMVRRQ